MRAGCVAPRGDRVVRSVVLRDEIVGAIESLLSPLGWDRSKIRRELAETRVPELTAFANTEET